MKIQLFTRSGFVGVLACVAGAAYAQEPTFQSQVEAEVVPGQYIVKTEPGVATEAVSLNRLGSEVNVIDTLPLIGAQVVEIADDDSFEALSVRAVAIDGIAYIEPVYVVRANAEPNDPAYDNQWGFPKISAPRAWDERTDSSDVLVAVIDSGVDYRHPDLLRNMWTNPGETPGNGVDDDGNGIVDDVHGANFFPSSATGDPMDDNGHGTHVAGTIGAVSDNNLGVAGVGWTASIMAVKFLGADGSGTTAGAIRAIEYATQMNARIMNNSWGGGGFSQALEDAIEIANQRQVLFLAAAGNSNNDNDVRPHYPSSYEVENVLAVMATDEDDNRAVFSSFGANSVDIAAPGVAILSTVPGGGSDSFSGTSMATPHVAGAAALVWAHDPSLTHTALKDRLMKTADIVPALSGDSVTGARLNLAAAMDLDNDPGDGNGDAACEADTHAQIAYEEFLLTDQQRVDQNSNILSVTFELPERMAIDITANTSGRRVAGSGNTLVRTGVFGQQVPNTMWTASYRRVSFAGADDNKILSSQFGIVLPAGSHTIWWKLWVSGATLQLDSGTLAVRAFPCTMGGQLDLEAAAEFSADVLEADPRFRSQVERLDTN